MRQKKRSGSREILPEARGVSVSAPSLYREYSEHTQTRRRRGKHPKVKYSQITQATVEIPVSENPNIMKRLSQKRSRLAGWAGKRLLEPASAGFSGKGFSQAPGPRGLTAGRSIDRISGTNRNRPPTRVRKLRGARLSWRTSAMAAASGLRVAGRSSSRLRGSRHSRRTVNGPQGREEKLP